VQGRLLTASSVTLMVLLLAACQTPRILGVSIDQDDLELTVGASTPLTVTVEAVGGASEAVIWSSNRGDVATVGASGIVSAFAEGQAIVTATSIVDHARADSITITVVAREDEVVITETQRVRVETSGATIVLATGNAVFVSEGVLDGADVVVSTRTALPAGLRAEFDTYGPVVELLVPLASPTGPSASSSQVGVPSSGTEWTEYGLGIKVVRSTDGPAPDFVLISIALNDGSDYRMLRPFLAVDGNSAYVAVAPSIFADLAALGFLTDQAKVLVAPATIAEDGISPTSAQALSTAPTGLYAIYRPFFEERHYAAVCPNAYDQLEGRSGAIQRMTSTVQDTGRTPLVLVHGWQALGNNVAAAQYYRENSLAGLGWKAFEWVSFGASKPLQHAFGPQMRFAAQICGWGHFIDYFFASGMDDTHDLFTFAYDSDASVAANATVLASEIANRFSGTAAYPRGVSILAHSMGGLVSHAAARQLSQHPGIELKNIVTYGTPYKGTTLLTCLDAQCESAGAHPDVLGEIDRILLRIVASAEDPSDRQGLLYGVNAVKFLLDRAQHQLVKHPGTRNLAWDEALQYRVPTGCPTTIGPANAPTPWCFVTESTFANPWLASLNGAPGEALGAFRALVGDIGSVRADGGFYNHVQEMVFQTILAGQSTDGIVPLLSADLAGRVETVATYPGGDHSLVGGGAPSALTCTVVQSDVTNQRRCNLFRDIAAVLVGVGLGDLTYIPVSLAATMPAGGGATQLLEIRNSGEGPAVIESMTPSATWLTVKPTTATIGSGGRVLVTVAWDATSLSSGTHGASLDVVWRSAAGEPGTVTDKVPAVAVVTPAVDQFRLFGSVRDQAGHPLVGVLIAVEVGGIPFAATTDAGGGYDFSFYRSNLAAANARFAKSGFVTHVEPIALTGSQHELHVTLDPVYAGNVLFHDGFEMCDVLWRIDNYDDGWWNCRDHAVVRNRAYVEGFVTLVAGDGSHGFVPTPYAGQRAYWYGDPSTGNYMGEQTPSDSALSGGRSTKRNGGRLISRFPIDLSGVSAAYLEGVTWYEVESVDIAQGQYDQMRVELWVGQPGSGGTLVVQKRLNPPFEPPLQSPPIPYTSGGNERPALWVPFAVDMTPLTGNADVFIVFDFLTVDGLYNGFRGWLIDEIRVIQGEAVNPAGSTPVVAPAEPAWEAPPRR
jgi:hypothetical protein